MKKIITAFLLLCLLVGLLSACTGNGNTVKTKGVIEKSDPNPVGETDQSWKALSADAQQELDRVYQEKLAATQALAEVEKKGTVYYISQNGNDSNNGTSPETAWASPSMAGSSKVKAGDTVLFECGSVFRRATNSTLFSMKSNVTYATYGEGEKPIFYGSVDASNPSDWENVGANVWRYKKAKFTTSDNDIGVVVFNGGEAWGIKIQMTYNSTKNADGKTYTRIRNYKSLALKDVSNGLQTFANVASFSLSDGGKDLKNGAYDLSFYHDPMDRYVYVYSASGNPASRFSSVEIAQSAYALSASNVSNVTIANLEFRNFGQHVIRTIDCTNLTVRNCNFIFVGGTTDMGYSSNDGAWRTYDTRLGNAVENWNSCNGMLVENCFFDQVYDTALTTQSNSNVASKNVVYRNNVIQNVWFGIELWTNGTVFENVDVSGNYCTKIGQGFTSQRPDKIEGSMPVCAFIKCSRGPYNLTNASVTHNYIIGPAAKMIACNQVQTPDKPNGYLFDYNTYVNTTNNALAEIPYRFWTSSQGSNYKYAYNYNTIKEITANGFETNGTFYYSSSSGQESVEYDYIIDHLPLYTYKAPNGTVMQFRLIFPDGYTEGQSYPLVTYFNIEGAAGTDNLKNVTVTKEIISKLISSQRAIFLIPQCPSGTWTGLSVSNGNYSTASTSESAVMQAVADLIEDVAAAYKTGKKYAIGLDAGGYAVSDLLVRHKDLLSAAIIVAGAGDPSANVGNAKVAIFHGEEDEVIPVEQAAALAAAWGAEFTKLGWQMHDLDCYKEALKQCNFVDWLLAS